MTGAHRSPDPNRRPDLVTPTTPIAAPPTAPIAGSDWPTRTDPFRGDLDT